MTLSGRTAGSAFGLTVRGVVRIQGNVGGLEPICEEEVEAVQRLLSTQVPCYGLPFLRDGNLIAQSVSARSTPVTWNLCPRESRKGKQTFKGR
jgi:hypothetical protein